MPGKTGPANIVKNKLHSYILECVKKLMALHKFLTDKREKTVECGLKYAEEKCTELEIGPEP